MTLYSNADARNWLFVIMPIGMLAILTVLLKLFPGLWNRTVGSEDARRNHTMDGARGLLSLWVLTHHLNILPFVLTPGLRWQAPQGAVTRLMGSAFFTAPFYTLTAMLFGGAMLASRGELNTGRFLLNRVFRLVPVYLLSIALVVLVAFHMTGFHLHEHPGKLVKELVRWSSFGFVRMYDINGAKVSNWHGMLWTLPNEVEFYLLLPLLAWGQRRLRSPLVLLGGLALIACFHWPFVFFTAGALAAAALAWKHPLAPLAWTWASVLGIAMLGRTAAYSGPVLQALFLVPLLVAAALQVPVMGLFRLKPIRFVGEISYSIYILHFPLICIALTQVLGPARVNALGYWQRFAVLTGLGAAIICLATLSYIFVERPVIAWGKQWQQRARARPSFWWSQPAGTLRSVGRRAAGRLRVRL